MMTVLPEQQMATILILGKYGPLYTGPIPALVYAVCPITGEISEHTARDNGVCNPKTGVRYLKTAAPWNSALFLRREDAIPVAAEKSRQFASLRNDSLVAFRRGFMAVAANFSDGFADCGTTIERECEESFSKCCETYPTEKSGESAASQIIEASELSPNDSRCRNGQRHSYRVLSHEEFRCARCGDVKFVPDL